MRVGFSRNILYNNYECAVTAHFSPTLWCNKRYNVVVNDGDTASEASQKVTNNMLCWGEPTLPLCEVDML